MIEVKVPALAESVTEGEIGSWLKKDGERVRKNEPILELQTDKASLEIAADADGVLRTLRAEGDVVKVGDVVGRIEEAGAATGTPAKAAAEKPVPAKGDAPKSGNGSPTDAAESPAQPRKAVAAPPAPRPAAPTPAPQPQSARAETPVAAPPAEAPAHVPDEPGTRRERMTVLRRRIAERLVDAQHQAAILTTFNEVDMTACMALRAKHQEWFTKRYGLKLGYMSLFSRAVIAALRDVPLLNASIDGQEIVHHDFVHLGIAVQTDKGLVVPIVRNAHAMGVGALEKEIARLAAQARAGKLGIQELQGGTFTISNGGVFGSLLSTPILTPPQTGILGMHAIQQRPVVLPDGAIVARPMMYVALSYDHRLVDGRDAVTFLVKVKQRLEQPDALVLEA